MLGRQELKSQRKTLIEDALKRTLPSLCFAPERVTLALLSSDSGWPCPAALAGLVSECVSHVPRNCWVVLCANDCLQDGISASWECFLCFDWFNASGTWLRHALKIEVSGDVRGLWSWQSGVDLRLSTLPTLDGYPVCNCTDMFISPPCDLANSTVAENLTLWIQAKEIGLLDRQRGDAPRGCEDFLGHKDPRQLLKDPNQWPSRRSLLRVLSSLSPPPFPFPCKSTDELLRGCSVR